MKTIATVNDPSKPMIGAPATSFGDRPVETTPAPTPFTESMLHELDEQGTGLLKRDVKHEDVPAPKTELASNQLMQELGNIVVTLKTLSGSILGDYQANKVVKEQIDAANSKLEKENIDAVEGGMQGVAHKRNEPMFLILQGIQNRLPGLVAAYEKMNTAKTPEAKVQFVNLYLSEINSAFNNIVKVSKDEINITDFKKQIGSDLPRLGIFQENKNKLELEFIQKALEQIQDPKAALPEVTIFGKLYNSLPQLLNLVNPFVAIVTGAYALGLGESYLLARLPDMINTFIALIQGYAGGVTVPLLCFGIVFAVKLVCQLGVSLKGKHWPVAPEVQLENQKKELFALFPQQAHLIRA